MAGFLIGGRHLNLYLILHLNLMGGLGRNVYSVVGLIFSLLLKSMLLKSMLLGSILLGAMLLGSAAWAGSIIVQSTTSTQNSGLYDFLLPQFTAQTGVAVHVVAVGSGQAIGNARHGDGDVLLVHAQSAEEMFVAQGFGVERFDVMYNDFVLVGPVADPANVRGAANVEDALARIAAESAIFASRGDDSGTHLKELALWQIAGVDPLPDSGKWYRETGSGMGANLNISAGMDAYTLCDRATWVTFANKSGLEILLQGDEKLLNQYGIIMVNPLRHSRVNQRDAQLFIDWILGDQGQAAIARYRVDDQQLFFPNARVGE